MKTICIYHGNCADGFGSAWVVRRWAKEEGVLDDFEFFPATYQKAPPDVEGKNVVMVDFSYKLIPLKSWGYGSTTIKSCMRR
jgi:hypothetical protein